FGLAGDRFFLELDTERRGLTAERSVRLRLAPRGADLIAFLLCGGLLLLRHRGRAEHDAAGHRSLAGIGRRRGILRRLLAEATGGHRLALRHRGLQLLQRLRSLIELLLSVEL